jgi:hypothetical protein
MECCSPHGVPIESETHGVPIESEHGVSHGVPIESEHGVSRSSVTTQRHSRELLYSH